MKKTGLLIGALLFSGNVFAVDGMYLEVGDGRSSNIARVGALWNWDKQWFAEGDWLVTGFWEASLGYWHSHSQAAGNQNIKDIGITPVFRLQQKNPGVFAPYAEGAIGFHLITPTYINASRRFGSAFQFGDHLGVGARFGDRRQFDLGFRYQHLSNGGIKQPNQGINFSQVRFAYYF
ncbi:acyloxyacyl hydrolase [Candidatus Ferrigenium straubiae]|jgi:hypothetical protein|uniref:acyloxyacyl hydrolase n=1 Tax=Candidatus Ferrigenium straubiae TaxID=2919506 RepID=UPI003F4AB8F2